MYSSTHSLTSALDKGSGQLHASAALVPGKNPQYPLDRRLGGPQSRSGCGGEKKNSQPLLGLPPPPPPIIKPVDQRYTTEISRLPLEYTIPFLIHLDIIRVMVLKQTGWGSLEYQEGKLRDFA
jgi:hypothetical protein